MTTASASFDEAIRAIRLAAAAADPLPHDMPAKEYERSQALALMPRLSFSFPVPGNPRGMTVYAVDSRETLEALADRLEKNARLFGGKPPAKVRKKTRTSGYQAARSAYAEGHHRQVCRALEDRLAFIANTGGDPLPVLIVEEVERAGHTWAVAWPIFGRSRKPLLVHVRTGLSGAINPSHGDILSQPDDFFCGVASRLPPATATLDQSAAIDAFIASDRVETLDAEAIAESEPCDVADAHAAIAEKLATDAAIHSGEDAPVAQAEPAQSIPDFSNAREADAWWRNRAASHPSQAAYRATAEYASFVRKTAPLYASEKSSASATMADAMQAAGIAPGDRVATTQTGAYLSTMTLTGTVVMRGGIPWVALDETIYVSRKGRVSDASRVRWSPAWKLVDCARPTDPERDTACHPPTASPATATATAAPLPPRLHQKLAQVPDQNAAHGAGSRTEATTTNFTRMDSAPVGTYPVNRLSRHRTRWRPRRTEDARFNPLQAEPIQNHNTRRWREPWDSVATDPPRARPGSMPPIHAVAAGARGSYPHHHSIQGCRLRMARKLHKPPDLKATHTAGSCRPRHDFTLKRRNLTSCLITEPREQHHDPDRRQQFRTSRAMRAACHHR